jgi:hypothetical protein
MTRHRERRRSTSARVAERRLDQGGHDLVEIGVRVDDHAVLAAHLAITPLEVASGPPELGGAAQDLEAERRPTRERDRCGRAGPATSAGAHVALARKEARGRPGGTPASRRASTSTPAHPGACSAGLRITALPRGQAGGDHAARDRDGEVPGRDDRHDAAPAQRRALRSPGIWRSSEPFSSSIAPARVVLEEVDRLAHVRVGFGPGLRRLAHGERGDPQPVGAQVLSRAQEDLGALGGRAVAPRRSGAPSRLESGVDVLRVATADRATTRSGAPGSVETERVAHP